MRKFLIVLLSVFLLTITGCSKKQSTEKKPEEVETVEEGDELEDPTAETPSSSLNVDQKPTISYDLSNLPSADKVGRRVETSFFSQRLLGNEIKIYEKIIKAAADWQETVSLEGCDEKTLARIMNIVLLDSTSSYNLDYSYSYDMMEGSDRYVSRLYLNYITSKEVYSAALDHINAVIRPYEELIMSETTIDKALDKAIKEVLNIIKTEKNSSSSRAENVLDNTVFTALSHAYFSEREVSRETNTEYFGLNSLETAKLLNLLLHHSGVNSLVALSDYKPSKNSDLVTVVVEEDGLKTASLNTEDFIWFNEIKINDNWYIINLREEYDRLSSNPNNSYVSGIDFTKSDVFYILVTDRIYASNHVFWQTDENLGILPPCDSLDFVYAYRNGDLIPEPNIDNPTPEQLRDYVSLFVEKLVEEVSPKSMAQSPTIVIRFENRDLYNVYNEFFSENVKNFASLSGRKIEDYEVEYHPEALMIILHDFYSY